jgi:hypothetical protein
MGSIMLLVIIGLAKVMLDSTSVSYQTLSTHIHRDLELLWKVCLNIVTYDLKLMRICIYEINKRRARDPAI